LSLVVAGRQALDLSAQVVVDFHVVSAWATLADEPSFARDLDVDPPDIETMELFPGWYDDWTLLERERFRHRVLHAAETLGRQRCQRGPLVLPLTQPICVVSADPLRESAQRVLIEAYLQEDNLVGPVAAVTHTGSYSGQELDVEPGAELTLLVNQSRSFDLPRPDLAPRPRYGMMPDSTPGANL
jgi:hypothetical protein